MLHAERLSIRDIENQAISINGGENVDGPEGAILENKYGTLMKNGRWDCHDRNEYADKLCRANGYKSKWMNQYDSMGNVVHVYLDVWDGSQWVSILKNRDAMADLEAWMERSRRF